MRLIPSAFYCGLFLSVASFCHAEQTVSKLFTIDACRINDHTIYDVLSEEETPTYNLCGKEAEQFYKKAAASPVNFNKKYVFASIDVTFTDPKYKDEAMRRYYYILDKAKSNIIVASFVGRISYGSQKIKTYFNINSNVICFNLAEGQSIAYLDRENTEMNMCFSLEGKELIQDYDAAGVPTVKNWIK